MAEFEFDLTEGGEFEAYPPVEANAYSEEMQQYLAAIHAVRTGVPIESARQEVAALGERLFAGQSRRDATALVNQKATETTSQAIEVFSLPAINEAEETRATNQEVVDNSRAPEVIATTQGNPGDVWDEIDSRTAARVSVSTKKLAEIAEGTQLTILSGILDFVDIVASYPFDILTGGGFHRADLAQEWNTLLTADISEEAFNDRLDEILEEAKDAGWFSDENALHVFGQIANIQEGAMGITARLDKMGTVLDTVFLPFSALSAGRAAVSGFRAARNTTAILGAMRGPKASREVLESALRNPGTAEASAAGIPEHTLPGYLRMPNSGVDPQAWSAPGLAVAAESERTNIFFNIIHNFNLSRRIDPPIFDAWVPKGIKALEDRLNAKAQSNIIQTRVDQDKSGNIFGSMLFGRRDGTPFGDKGHATQFANKHGGEVVPITQGDKTFYMVEQIKNLSAAGLVDPLDSWEIGNHFFGAWGATFLTIPRRLEALAKRGEGVLGNLSTEIAPLVRSAIKATNKEERANVERVFWSLRDGDLSEYRRALTMPEFRNEWSKYSDIAPSKNAENLYLTIQELNDALYWIKADRVFKDVVDEGHQVSVFKHTDANGNLTERNILIRSAPEDLAEDTLIYDPVSGARIKLKDLKANQKVYVVDGGIDVGGEVARYMIADTNSIRRVFHSDVLGYNPGGPRGYDFINFVVKQGTEVRFIDGATTAGRAKTFLGTATRKEAELAVEQVSTILAKVRDIIPGIRQMTKSDAMNALRAVRGDEGLLAVVKANRDWNLASLGDTNDFIRFMEQYGLDPRLNISMGHMDDALGTVDDAGNLVFNVRRGETNRSDFDGVMNQPRNGPRQNDPLIGFGGDRAQTVSPIDMISRDFIRATHERAFSAYNFQAVDGWLAGIKNHLNIDSVKGLRPREAMNAVVFPDHPNDALRGYMRARDSINRTLGHVSEHEKMWNGFVNRFADQIYDKGWKKTAKTIAQAQLSKRPLEAIRGFAFDAKLGLFAFDQMFVQSSQIFNILAIAGGRRAFPAMAAATPLRMTLVNTSEAFAREVGRRSAAFTGMDADEFVRFSRWVRESGRTVIGGEVAELNAVNHVMAKGLVGRVREVGRVFFNEGERFPRMVGMHVAWKEYAKKWPTLDPFANHGLNWITFRQDALTASMTRASAATWQKGPLSVPFQFLSYSSRMMESIFSNRLLSKGERVRLASAQALFWGAAGTGVGGPVLDWWVTEGGLEIEPNTYTALRYGILDWAIGVTTGVDTGVGSRLAVGEGFWNLWEDISHEATVSEAIGGPALSTITDFTDVIFQSMVDMGNGRTEMLAGDAKKLLRNFTGPNKLYNAWIIYTMGDYLARNETVVVSGLTKGDALAYVMGAPLQEASLSYTRLQVMQDKEEHIKTLGKRMAEGFREMDQRLKDGDDEGAANLAKEIAGIYGMQDPYVQRKLQPFWEPQARSFFESILDKARRQGQANIDLHRDRGDE